MIYYLKDKPNASGAYPTPQAHPGPGTIPISKEQRDMVLQYNGFVTVTPEADEHGAVSYKVEPNSEAWEEWKAAQPDPLAEMKTARITQSKTDLDTYLAAHPLLWTDGNYYSITEEKQRQLTSKLAVAQAKATLGVPYELKWNTTEEVCVPWELSDLYALAFAIDERVTALVTYQQEQEVKIRNAATQDELDAIIVDYDTVQ